MTDIYPRDESVAARPAEVRELTFVEALNEALDEEMALNPALIIIGEDIAQSGGLFGVTQGLLDRFGADRVMDSPISEAGIVGFGVGAALMGYPAVVEIQIMDFLTLAMDQIVNHAAKARYMSGGQNEVPVVIRGPVASGIGMAAQHSQSLEAWFVHTPGLAVVMPSTPADAKGLLKSAIRSKDPVVFFEKRTLYSRKGSIPSGDHLVPLGSADIKASGTDLTIVGVGDAVNTCLAAAKRLSSRDISAEVVDPRTLKPLDLPTILASVKKTGRLMVVTEATPMAGFAAEVIASCCEHAMDALRKPPLRVTSADVPMPFSAPLESAVLPSLEKVIRLAESLVANP